MRRLLSLFAVGFLGLLSGCHATHSHGICDCEYDNHCASRAPWVQHNGVHSDIHTTGATTAPETVVVPPSKLPDGKKKDL